MNEGDVEIRDEKTVSCLRDSGRNLRRVEQCEHQTYTARREDSIQNEALMEIMLGRANMEAAYRKVISNKGSPGVDGMTTKDLKAYLQTEWMRIKEELLMGKYKPQPVKQVEIPKPDGGVRKLGIPTVIDRLIQQGIHQILNPIFDPNFSESSYGFRPGRGAHQAILKAREYIAEGRRWVVDLDLEKFFDRVNHDILMSRIARKIKDKRILLLIRKYLQTGIMIGGLETAREEGTPQGGPLSPLLSNILLDELDKELEARGHKFCRYADDCNIYVKSKEAGERVMQSLKVLLEKRLKLKVNEEKSKVERPWNRKFLGYTVTKEKKSRISIAPKTIDRMKDKIREIIGRSRGRSLKMTIEELKPKLRGWINYFRYTEVDSTLKELDKWIRRKLRKIIWEQMKTPRKRAKEMIKRGVAEDVAKETAGSHKGAWRNAITKAMHIAFSVSFFEDMGLVSLFQQKQKFSVVS
jgi:RNA-directed DNA polymerase